jgi:hypothetical protein
MPRREIQLLRTAMIGGATFAAALTAVNRAHHWNALRSRSHATAPAQRTSRPLG